MSKALRNRPQLLLEADVFLDIVGIAHRHIEKTARGKPVTIMRRSKKSRVKVAPAVASQVAMPAAAVSKPTPWQESGVGLTRW